jgi:sortase A
MNPQNTPEPHKLVVPARPIRSASAPDPTRAAAAGVIREQIDQILDVDDQPNRTISVNSQPMIDQPAATTNDSTAHAFANSVYEQVHAPTSNTANLTPDDNRIANRAAEIAAEQAEEAAVAEAHRKYHTAWQQYYQKYYEQYYIAALQEQREAFAKMNAVAPANNQPGGTLSQKEAIEELRTDIISKIKRGAKKVRKSRHFIPAICAIVVIVAAVLIQYNGLIFAQVASFVSPGDTTDQNIIVGTGANQPVSQDPRIIIPKINVNAPIVYNLSDLSEESSQNALQNGPIHYPIQGASAYPGQNGNTVILGHSSADWFEPGNYKFIFVQLNRLATGDLFYLDYQGVRYTYRVSRTEIINPDQVSALAIGDAKPYATLITCDPPGTAYKRLVVFAEQISPDPNGVTENQSDSGPTVQGDVVGNPPTLFEKIFGGK